MLKIKHAHHNNMRDADVIIMDKSIKTKQNKIFIMRKMLSVVWSIMLALCMASCDAVDFNVADEVEKVQTAAKTKNVKFKIGGLVVSNEDFDDAPMSRASLADANITDLWVIDDGQVLCHQLSTDSDFGTPNIAMTYGRHNLAFVATRGEGVSIKDGDVTMDKVKDTFCKYVTLDVSATTLQQSVTLERSVCGLRLTVLDTSTLPVASVRVTYSSYYGGFHTPYFEGVKTDNVAKSVTTPAGSFLNPNLKIMFYSFSAVLGDEWETDIIIDFLDAGGNVLISHSLTDVPMLANRVTNIQGNFFGNSLSGAVKVNADWSADHVISL